MGISEETTLYSEVDIFIIKWQGGLLSDFDRSIMQTISKADDISKEKLRVLFPVQVKAFFAWTTTPGYAENLRERLQDNPFLGQIDI